MCLSAPKPLAADTVEDFRIWGNVTAITNLGLLDPSLGRYRWWMEGQGRFREAAGEADQALVRTGMGYAVMGQATVWLGYAYVAWYRAAGGVLDEHRPWQQFLWSESMPWGDLTSRSRLEQRFIEGLGNVSWRIREFVRFSRPIAQGSALGFVVWDEVFVHLNSVSPALQSGFDQNRAFAGLSYQLNKQVRAEIGYMNQFIRTEPENRVNHVLSLNFFLNL